MTDFILTLGGIDFQEFEVPESIKAGGKQALAIQKYPGGLRTVDTTGPDDIPITWSGYFEDDDAEIRCQQLDTMRRQGSAVQLTWSSYSYLVTIESFEWDFRRFYHIPYSISLVVVQDQTQPGQGGFPDPESVMQGDIGSALDDALGFVGGVASGLSGAIQTVQDTVATVQSIVNAPTQFLTSLGLRVAGATELGRSVLAAADTAMSVSGAAANFAAGTDPLTMAANVNNLVQASAALPLAFDCTNRLVRLGKNIAAVTG